MPRRETDKHPQSQTLAKGPSVEDEEQKRQFQLYRHTLGDAPDRDVLVYEETDERFNIGAGKTRDNKYLLLESASHTTSEQRYLQPKTPLAPGL